LKVFPGSGGVARLIERPDQRLGGESIANVFRAAGAVIRQSWCGPCFGQGPDQLAAGQRAITTFNRNWQNRMGLGGEGFLASPAGGGRVRAARLHGSAERARPRVGSRTVRGLSILYV
jgi:homoaconitase/3-isopropylmalate dehydratase large subunit